MFRKKYGLVSSFFETYFLIHFGLDAVLIIQRSLATQPAKDKTGGACACKNANLQPVIKYNNHGGNK
jgi:hypothetical protein